MLADTLDTLRVTTRQCADAPAWPLTDEDLIDHLNQIHTAQQHLNAAAAHLIREIEGRNLPAAAHTTSTAVWLRDQLHISIHTAKHLTDLARRLDHSPALDAALSHGTINFDQARTITAALDALPTHTDPAVRRQAEHVLIGHAHQFEPAILRKLGDRILAHIDPDAADRTETATLTRQQARAHAGRTLHLTDTGQGRYRLTGWLDAEAAATINAALDPLCRPTTQDTRTPGQRRADALTEICRLSLNSGDLPTNGGDRPQLIVTVPYDLLHAQLGTGVLDTGQRLTAEQVRRLACDAQLTPAVLGGNGQVLDLGRTRRLFTGPIRRALAIRDQGCAFPGCDRPPRWCDAHHITAWTNGGSTSIDNGVLLCRHHHHVIHHQQWTIRLGPDRRPEFIPPAYLDPTGEPRRNIYHHPTPTPEPVPAGPNEHSTHQPASPPDPPSEATVPSRPSETGEPQRDNPERPRQPNANDASQPNVQCERGGPGESRRVNPSGSSGRREPNANDASQPNVQCERGESRRVNPSGPRQPNANDTTRPERPGKREAPGGPRASSKPDRPRGPHRNDTKQPNKRSKPRSPGRLVRLGQTNRSTTKRHKFSGRSGAARGPASPAEAPPAGRT